MVLDIRKAYLHSSTHLMETGVLQRSDEDIPWARIGQYRPMAVWKGANSDRGSGRFTALRHGPLLCLKELEMVLDDSNVRPYDLGDFRKTECGPSLLLGLGKVFFLAKLTVSGKRW